MMAYKIEYSPEMACRYPQELKSNGKTKKWLVVGCLVAALLWIRLNGVPDFLIPGNKEVTKEAAGIFVEDLRNGKKVEEAVTEFCKTILNDGQY